MNTVIHTEFGMAKLNHNGYYAIISGKEGNNGKLLHRLIYERYHKCTLLPKTVIHHIDGNIVNNCILNLKAMLWSHHARKHHKGIKFTEEHKKKISDAQKGIKNHRYGVTVSEDECVKRSKATSKTNVFRVHKKKCKSCKLGFIYVYQYATHNKKYSIYSTNINKLEKKVKEKGLLWIDFSKESD